MEQMVGEWIKQQRQTQKLSQEDLAKKVGVNRSYISQIESLAALPSKKVAAAMATVLQQNPDDFWTAIQREKVIIKDRSTRTQVELSSLDYLLSQTRRSFRYIGFSAAFCIIGSYEKLIELLNRGGRLQLILAEPNAENLYRRVVEDYRIKDINIAHIIRRMQEEYLKLLNAILHLVELRHDHQKAGTLLVHFRTKYEPGQRITIIDDEFALVRPCLRDESEKAFSIYTNYDSEFEEAERTFSEISAQSSLLSWENWLEKCDLSIFSIGADEIQNFNTKYSQWLNDAATKEQKTVVLEKEILRKKQDRGNRDSYAIGRFLEQMKNALPPQQNKAILLHYAGYTNIEIANMLGITRQGASQLIKTAKYRLND